MDDYGIYIHIPFCASKCFYCDFFSRKINDKNIIDAYVKAICKEIELRKDYLDSKKIKTIYFGGGTPSQLPVNQIINTQECIKKNFDTSQLHEVTLEANPEDLTSRYLSDLKEFTKINRLSIGIQSFDDEELKKMNRRHSAVEALNSIKNARKAGFDNLTIDLIYGLPDSNLEKFKKNLEILFSLDLPHFSAYHLTIEENTVFGVWKRQGKIKEIDEQTSWQLFSLLRQEAQKKGYLHYEISNFAKPGNFAIHNTMYWKGGKYLGLGASAHSYNGISRQWNIANIRKYIESINKGIIPAENEILTPKDKFNEYLLTRLRTMWGVNPEELSSLFPQYFQKIKKTIDEFIDKKFMEEKDDNIILTEKGLFISDTLISELMII